MAPVEYIAGWKCYNMNPQKFERLINNFFGSSCLEMDVFDQSGKQHTQLLQFNFGTPSSNTSFYTVAAYIN